MGRCFPSMVSIVFVLDSVLILPVIIWLNTGACSVGQFHNWFRTMCSAVMSLKPISSFGFSGRGAVSRLGISCVLP